jgi:hypothetical protein
VPRAELRVVYDTVYAEPQHERVDFEHREGRQAKYLEDPLKEMAGRYREAIAALMRRGMRGARSGADAARQVERELERGLPVIGNDLLGRSQRIVPLEEGTLAGSGHLEPESGVDWRA